MDLTEEASRMCHEAEARDAEDVAYTQETDLQVRGDVCVFCCVRNAN